MITVVNFTEAIVISNELFMYNSISLQAQSKNISFYNFSQFLTFFMYMEHGY